jgi:hypothetical protein
MEGQHYLGRTGGINESIWSVVPRIIRYNKSGVLASVPTL